MTDEVGQHFRISITFWMTGAFISAVIGVTIFGFITYRNYTGKYTDAMQDAASSVVYDLSRETKVTCPAAYRAINSSIGQISKVTISPPISGSDGSSITELYNYRTGTDELIYLMTGKYTTKNVRITITPSAGSSHMIDVTLTEVD